MMLSLCFHLVIVAKAKCLLRLFGCFEPTATALISEVEKWIGVLDWTFLDLFAHVRRVRCEIEMRRVEDQTLTTVTFYMQPHSHHNQTPMEHRQRHLTRTVCRRIGRGSLRS